MLRESSVVMVEESYSGSEEDDDNCWWPLIYWCLRQTRRRETLAGCIQTWDEKTCYQHSCGGGVGAAGERCAGALWGRGRGDHDRGMHSFH